MSSAEDGLVGVARDRFREWRRHRAWSRLKEWEALDRRRGDLAPLPEYRWNLRGEWLRRRVERFGEPTTRG